MLNSRSSGFTKVIVFLVALTGLLAIFVHPTSTKSFLRETYDKAGSLVSNVDHHSSAPFHNTRYDGRGDLLNYPKPPIRVAAIILAGRKEYIEVLRCYLERNLVRNGGWLDEVLFIIRPIKDVDRVYLNDLIESVPEYIAYDPPNKKDLSYTKIYSQCRTDTIYVKIDDDVAFWEDHTIPAIVKRLWENPQYSVVSANMLNQPAFSWVHYHMDTALPFAPELQKPPTYKNLDEDSAGFNWRPSTLPAWTGPQDYNFSVPATFAAPFKHHRWLPLPGQIPLEKTAVGVLGQPRGAEYTSNNSAWLSWTISAQQHYSFLTHVENHELWKYKFDLWNYHYERISINFIAFWGKDIAENPVRGSDEAYITMEMPKHLGRPAVMDGSSMAVHFGFHRQVSLTLLMALSCTSSN